MNKKHKIIFPQGTAKWLVNNTKLTLDQICSFCNDISPLELEILKDKNIQSFNPIGILLSNQNIKDCEQDSNLQLLLINSFDCYQPRRLTRNKMSIQNKKFKKHYVQWFLENKNDRNICINKILYVLKVRFITINTIYNNLINNESEIESINPLNHQVCTNNDIQNIYQDCNCDKYCKDFNNSTLNSAL